MLTLLSILLFSATAPQSDPLPPLPRIAIAGDHAAPCPFIQKDTATPYQPRGFNHVVLEQGSAGWHALFNVGIYDPDAAERTLSAMAALGANVVRVWAWGAQNPSGYTGLQEGVGLNPAYMANFMDFLERATRHGIYVLPILDETPTSAHYRAIRDAAPRAAGESAISGYNAQFLSSGPIAAKAQCIRDFIHHLRERRPDLLSTIFGWALSNEVHVRVNAPPFDRTEGAVATATGRTYELGSFEERQRCWDEGVLHWANTLADAVHAADPEALVTAGMWTSDAHGRPPVNGLQDDGKDPRFPPRPSVLGGMESRLDFIDVHIYPWDGTSRVNATAHERDGVVRPAIAGEFGVFKNKTPKEARVMMQEMLAQAYALGYAGDLYWVWDLSMVEGQTWSAVEEGFGEYVFRELTPSATRGKP